MVHITEQTNDRLAITAGLLTLPNAQGTQAWFNIFVLESSLHFEIQEGAEDGAGQRPPCAAPSLTYTYSAPVFLLDDVRTQGYRLPEVSVQAMERFTHSGGRVIEAMVASIQSEMRDMAQNSKMESQWCDHPERLIWGLVRTHVPADIQLPVFAMLKPYRHYFDDTGRIGIQRSEP